MLDRVSKAADKLGFNYCLMNKVLPWYYEKKNRKMTNKRHLTSTKVLILSNFPGFPDNPEAGEESESALKICIFRRIYFSRKVCAA